MIKISILLICIVYCFTPPDKNRNYSNDGSGSQYSCKPRTIQIKSKSTDSKTRQQRQESKKHAYSIHYSISLISPLDYIYFSILKTMSECLLRFCRLNQKIDNFGIYLLISLKLLWGWQNIIIISNKRFIL